MSKSQRKMQRRGKAQQRPPLSPLHILAAAHWLWSREAGLIRDSQGEWVLGPDHKPDRPVRTSILKTAEQLEAELGLGPIHCLAIMNGVNEEIGLSNDDVDIFFYSTMSTWYADAMPTVAFDDPKLVASLMCTHLPESSLEDFRPPFPAVMVEIPDDLLYSSEPAKPIRNALLSREVVNGEAAWHVWCFDATELRMYMCRTTIGGLLDDRIKDNLGDAAHMIIRLMVNACCMMTENSGEAAESRVPHPYSQRRQGPPDRRCYRFTRAVVHDVRKAVRDHSLHGGKSPTVQCVVTGHWKMQAHGPGRTERKRIFIEPYWRGPEDAPIALRPHVLKQ